MPSDRSIKRSISTSRANPLVEGRTSVAGLVIHGEVLIVPTRERVELIDLTERITAMVGRLEIKEGLVSLWSLHTTCALLINESQAALLADIKRFLEQIVGRDEDWMHNDPSHSDCDRMNADAHLRALLLGHSLSLQVSSGDVVLGQWQRVLMAELDGPRDRSIRAQIWGIG